MENEKDKLPDVKENVTVRLSSVDDSALAYSAGFLQGSASARHFLWGVLTTLYILYMVRLFYCTDHA